MKVAPLLAQKRAYMARPLLLRETGVVGGEGAGLNRRRAGEPAVEKASEIVSPDVGGEANLMSGAGWVVPWLVPSGETASSEMHTRPKAAEPTPNACATSS